MSSSKQGQISAYNKKEFGEKQYVISITLGRGETHIIFSLCNILHVCTCSGRYPEKVVTLYYNFSFLTSSCITCFRLLLAFK